MCVCVCVCELCLQEWMYVSCLLSAEDSGRGSSIPSSPGSHLLSHTTNDPHTTQECTEESPLTKEASLSPNRTPPTPTAERRSSGTSLEESGHSASSGEGHPLLSSSEEGHPLLSLSYGQLQKPTTSTQDSVAMIFQNGFTPLHSAIRVRVRVRWK